MKSGGNKRKFRKADGHPEPRGVDETLRDAAARGEFDNLPGKGRPIDLGDYFSSDPENRVADRLLRDNRILPDHLQGRKEAEDLEEARPSSPRQGREGPKGVPGGDPPSIHPPGHLFSGPCNTIKPI